MNIFKTIILIVATNFVLISQNQYKDKNFLDKNVIFKIKYKYVDNLQNKSFNNSYLTEVFTKNTTVKIFPNKKENAKLAKNMVDLSLLYSIEFNTNDEAFEFIKNLYKLELVEYAEYKQKDYLLYTPNDEYISSQYYLNNLHIYEAWDITKGDSTIIIGITDTGIDINHTDLNANIYKNQNDPIDGIDNDFDGYTDNFWGWDLGNNDNNPQWDEIPTNANAHGVYVSGCASAVADNNFGIAGIGFKTKIMPIKVSASNGNEITHGYEGIVYAADHGCSIINCSWGSTSYSQFGQDIINYATFNKNALVVAAAGNNGLNLDFYPASYKNVLSIGGSNITDNKWAGSNYGIYVDVMAPGENVYFTSPNNNFTSGWGTSFASPLAAGCAAIIKSHFDTLSALQIGEILRLSADNIDTIQGNENYSNLMGGGRINLYKAVTQVVSPAIRYENVLFETNLTNDTMLISGNFINYLKSTNNLNVLLTSESEYVQIIDGTFNAGIINENDTVNNFNNPFIIKILASTPIDETIYFKLNYSDNTYYDFQMIKEKVNLSYVDIDTNNIKTTITNNGMFAFNTDGQGSGFKYKQSDNLTSDFGIIMGLNDTTIQDCVRGNNKFEKIGKSEYKNSQIAHQEIESNYINTNDTVMFNVKINQNTFAWKTIEFSDFIIVNYNIINVTDSILQNYYFGLFSDWDIDNYNFNSANYNSENKISYTFSTQENGIYSGFQLLSDTICNNYSFDNIYGGNGGIDITDGFSTEEKYQALTNNKQLAGSGLGNDVCSMLSCGPYSILPNDTLFISYAIHSANNYESLITNCNSVKYLYDSLFARTNFIPKVNIENKIVLYPNPSENEIIISGNFENTNYTISIYTIFGQLLLQKEQNLKINNKIDVSNLKKGIYIIKIQNKNSNMNMQFIKN